MRGENQTKARVREDLSLCPETSTKYAVQEFHLKTVAPLALTVRRSNHPATSHPMQRNLRKFKKTRSECDKWRMGDGGGDSSVWSATSQHQFILSYGQKIYYDNIINFMEIQYPTCGGIKTPFSCYLCIRERQPVLPAPGEVIPPRRRSKLGARKK
jgi:hypothetical protein